LSGKLSNCTQLSHHFLEEINKISCRRKRTSKFAVRNFCFRLLTFLSQLVL
jgi:hypothetical protein